MTNSIKPYVKADTMPSKNPSHRVYMCLLHFYLYVLFLNLGVPTRSPLSSLKLLYNNYITKYCVINITIHSVLFFMIKNFLKWKILILNHKVLFLKCQN